MIEYFKKFIVEDNSTYLHDNGTDLIKEGRLMIQEKMNYGRKEIFKYKTIKRADSGCPSIIIIDAYSF